MSWYALEAIDEAVEETKELLLPFDAWMWAKLAVLVLFTSGFGIPSNLPMPDSGDRTQYSGYDTSPYGTEVLDSVDVPVTGMASAVDSLGPAAYGAGLLVLLLFIALMAVSTIFVFVYYKSLLDKEVAIRRNFRAYLGEGLRLFVFYSGVLVTLLLFAVGALMIAQANPTAVLLAMLAAIPAFIVLVVFLQLTLQFIPLIMIDKDVALIPAWQIFYDKLQEEWKQIGLYVIGWFVLKFAVGILVMLASLPLLLVAIPVIVVVILLDLSQAAMIAIAVVGVVAALVLILYFLRVPAQTYLRYYTILVYQKLDV